MKTAVTDRTLSYMKYDPDHVSAASLKAYANAVFACGADYMELNTQTAALMDIDDFSEKYMLTVNGPYDAGFCTSNPFAYAVVPLKSTEYLSFLPEEQPVIVEVNADEYSAPAMLTFLHTFGFIRRISAIRVTGLFGDSIDELVKWCRTNLYIPVDFCPLNTMMTGASDAVIAQSAGAEMLTLSFGRGYYFTALENFIINLHIMHHSRIQQDMIKAMCIASFLFTDLFSVIPAGLASMLDSGGDIGSTVVCDIEEGVTYRPLRAVRRPAETRTESVIDRKIRSIGLEQEIEDAIIDMLKKVNFSFYKEITKRNPID